MGYVRSGGGRSWWRTNDVYIGAQNAVLNHVAVISDASNARQVQVMLSVLL